MKQEYWVSYVIKQHPGLKESGPFSDRKTAEAFVVAFVNRTQVEWINIVEKEMD